MSDWGIVSIIVSCILVGFGVQICICYAVFYASKRNVSDDLNEDNSPKL